MDRTQSVQDRNLLSHSATPAAKKSRIVGVDATRGLALIGMMAVHVFDDFGRNGEPTIATTVALGRAMATFVLLAGVSLALISGGRHPTQGRVRTAAAAGIAVRAALIGIIGLALAYTDPGVDIILVYYAVFFLLAIPLLSRRPRVLAGVAAASIMLAPLLLFATFHVDLPSTDDNATFGTLVHQPVGLTLDLLLTGVFPALPFLAYIAAGLAIGRLDMSAKRVAVRLLAGGLALTLSAWLVSWVLLYPLGGLQHLVAAGAGSVEDAAPRVSPDTLVLWDMDPTTSWWWLAGRAPHSSTPIDLMLTLGAAMALLGAVLLLTRTTLGVRLLSPVAAAGSMTLTLYTAHVLFLATGVLDDNQIVLYLLQVIAALAFGVIWRRWRGQGPLEKLVAAAASRARQAVYCR
jgi:uncharacterized membrane protein